MTETCSACVCDSRARRADRQTDKQTDKHTRSSQYSASQWGRRNSSEL